MRIALILLALPLASCAAIPTYNDPRRVAKIEHLREVRNSCLIQSVPQFDDRSSDAAKVGAYVAMSCSVETGKLVELAIPHPSRHDRDAFQEEAVYRATGYVLTARRMEVDAVQRQQQPPTPLQ